MPRSRRSSPANCGNGPAVVSSGRSGRPRPGHEVAFSSKAAVLVCPGLRGRELGSDSGRERTRPGHGPQRGIGWVAVSEQPEHYNKDHYENHDRILAMRCRWTRARRRQLARRLLVIGSGPAPRGKQGHDIAHLSVGTWRETRLGNHRHRRPRWLPPPRARAWAPVQPSSRGGNTAKTNTYEFSLVPHTYAPHDAKQTADLQFGPQASNCENQTTESRALRFRPASMLRPAKRIR